MEDFDGYTFVAFIDISGFKNILKKNRKKARETLSPNPDLENIYKF